MKLSSVIIAFLISISAQINKDTINNLAKGLNLLPLTQVDTTSKKLPPNLTTKSDWHIDYYARSNFSNQLNLYTFIYNNVTEWHYWKPLHFNHGQITYDSLNIFLESNDFLYLKYSNNIDTIKNITIVPKKENNEIYQFTQLIYADYNHNIFIEYNPRYCQISNIIYLSITNLNTAKVKEIKFKKGTCDGGKNNWCINNVTYQDGVLTISVTVTNKRTKKEIIETQKIDI